MQAFNQIDIADNIYVMMSCCETLIPDWTAFLCPLSCANTTLGPHCKRDS